MWQTDRRWFSIGCETEVQHNRVAVFGVLNNVTLRILQNCQNNGVVSGMNEHTDGT